MPVSRKDDAIRTQAGRQGGSEEETRTFGHFPWFVRPTGCWQEANDLLPGAEDRD